MMATFRMNKIIITLLILFSATAYGAEVDNALLQKNLEAANTQIEVLKAQVEVMKSYQDNFLTTVYWSLGTVLGIVVLLIGLNWFTNFKNQEKEIHSLKIFIENEIREKKHELDNDINEKITSLLTKENRNVWREINYLKYNQLLDELNKSKMEGLYGICLRTINELISIVSVLPGDYRLKEVLDIFVEVIELAHEKKYKYILSSECLALIHEMLNRIGEEYSMVKNKVNDLLLKMQTF